MNLQQRFQQVLDALPVSSHDLQYLVAYSGGMDSHVLLHLCRQSGVPVRAVHINHGLQQQAGHWSEHCATVCREMDVAFLNIKVEAQARNGDSPENAARKARYAALYAQLGDNECLLTAHHLDDQSETLLLQLFRGAGPAGLASMPRFRTIQGIQHARPMLDFGRDEILSYANRHGLSWVEDPSNKNNSFDRNLVRNTVLPLLKQRWSQLDDSLSQVAEQQQQTLELIEAMAAVDLAAVISRAPDVLSIEAINRLSPARQLNLLRLWIRQFAKDGPTANVLQQLRQSLLTAAHDAAPVVHWGQTEIRRYQDGLYLMPAQQHDETANFCWQPEQVLRLDERNIELSVSRNELRGLGLDLLQREFRVAFRTGGETIRPAGRGHSHSLKKLMQEAGIPPWQRSRIPLLYLDDELVCVCGYWLAEDFVVEDGWIPVCTVI